MGRALMIPGFVGKNVEKWIAEGDIPNAVNKFGTTKEEIFVTWETIKDEFGADADDFPMGALGIYTYSDKLKVGLQQLMSGSRNMTLPSISRDDVMALTREASEISGIPFVTDAYREEALKIIDA
jgi:hypothetical protein